jgi:hypothetical protein
MVDRLIELSLRNRFLVAAFFVLVGAWGYSRSRTGTRRR